MTQSEFDQVVEDLKRHTFGVLEAKGREYAPDGDRLENFRVGASLIGCGPPMCCWSYLAKHLASLSTMVRNPGSHGPAMWDEKIGDAINYLVLLRACAQEAVEDAVCDNCQEPRPDRSRRQPLEEALETTKEMQHEVVPTEFVGKYVPVLVNPSSPDAQRPVCHGKAKVRLGDVAIVEDGWFECDKPLSVGHSLEVTDGERCFVCVTLSSAAQSDGQIRHYFRSKQAEPKSQQPNGQVLPDGRVLKSQLAPNMVEMMLRMGRYRDDGTYLVPVKGGDA